MSSIVALFPLSHVLLPGMPLPLHIFEQRYRDLITDLDLQRGTTTRLNMSRSSPIDRSFGVIALRSGTEAQGVHGHTDDGPDVETVGTMAEILEFEQHDDGTSDLLSVGSRRFRVRSLITEGAAYLRGEVEFLDEQDGRLDRGQDRRARDLLEVYDALLTRLAGRATGSELPRDANDLSYHIAARLPLPPGERQTLLCDVTAAERLERVARLLRREIALLQGTRSIAVSPAVLRIATGVN